MDIHLNKIQSKNINIAPFGQTQSLDQSDNKGYADYKSIYNKDIEAQKLNLAFKANTMAQLPDKYKEIQTFDVPFLDKGRIYQLENGQKVIIIPKEGPTAINTYVKVGSFNEPERIKGISHYIEHNLFNGSHNLASGEFVKQVNNLGGEYNAGTETLSTNYYITSPLHHADDLDKFIGMHADMLQNPSFLQEMLDKEKGPVISEIHMYNDIPKARAGNTLIKNLFNIKSDNDLIAGSEKTIRDVTKEDVMEFYNKWYTPDNMTTVIVGDVNPAETIKLVSKYFNSAKKITNPADKYYLPLDNPVKSTVRADFVTSGVNTVDLQMAFIGPKNNDIKGIIATNAMGMAISGYEGAKLAKVMKEFNTDASFAVRELSPNINDPQVIALFSQFKPGDEENGLKAIYFTLHNFTQTPINQQELDIIKLKLKNNLASASENSMNLSNIIGGCITNNGNLNLYTDWIKTVDSLTVKDIQDAARQYLDLNKASIVMLHPENQQISPVNTIKVNNKLSFTGNVSNIKMENVQEYDLSNNLRLLLNNDPKAIRTTASLVLSMNKIPPSKPGVYEIISSMMNDSTKNYNAEQLSELIDSHDLDISLAAGYKAIGTACACDNRNLPLSLDVMKEMLFNPVFTQDKLNKAREEIKLAYLSEFENPKDRAFEFLYGEHPLGYSSRKVLENIDNVTLDDVKSFYDNILQNAQAKAVITAPLDKTPELSSQIFTSLTQNFPTVQKYKVSNKFHSNPLEKNHVITEASDRDQAHIVQMFKISETGNIKDSVSIALLNKILGGSSQSRLFRDLRESQKLAYMVKSNYSSNGKTGTLGLEIKTTTKTVQNGNIVPQYENLQKSLDGFNMHIKQLIETPVSKEELEGAKLAIKTEIINDMESSAGKTSLLINGLDSPYGKEKVNELLKEIDNITAVDVQKTANLYLKQPSVISVIASKDTINNKKDYLASLGTLSQY